jgi:hypothetical protein
LCNWINEILDMEKHSDRHSRDGAMVAVRKERFGIGLMGSTC